MMNNITRWLFYSTALGVLLLLGRLTLCYYPIGTAYSGRSVALGFPPHLFFIWNVFLAWIPYWLSAYFKEEAKTNWRHYVVTFLWLLFLPNAPYIITDLQHLKLYSPMPIWYDSLLFFLFALTGLALGFFSMRRLDLFWKLRTSKAFHTPLIIFVWTLCSIGVYIGREGRWNSWDLFTRPWDLLVYVVELFSLGKEGFSFLIFVIVYTFFFVWAIFFW